MFAIVEEVCHEINDDERIKIVFFQILNRVGDKFSIGPGTAYKNCPDNNLNLPIKAKLGQM